MKNKPNEFRALFSNGLNMDIADENSMRILSEDKNGYSIEYKSKIYNVVIDRFDETTKSYNLIINNKPVELSLKNKLDQLIDQMGLNKKGEENFTQIKAPMPGLVLKVHVQEGASVQEGDPLITLEAMKMENLLKSKGKAVVKKIHINENDKVEKAQLLIEFD